ncbi:MAG: hypothetical protein P1V51_09130 [Deltaproteobacteria bacterium]|nr:hypothetical protein [Deltaproteobacteria bacterium]
MVGYLTDLLKDIDRPMVKGDFKGQHKPLQELERLLGEMQLKSLADLGDELRGKALTLLLRVGRQHKEQDDAEKEADRKGVHARLARVWMALDDQKRAAACLAAAGKEKAAAAVLKESGDWEGRVELYEAVGQWGKAAQTLEGHGMLAEAAEAFGKAKDLKNQLRVLAALGDQEAMVGILGQLPKEEARQLAIRYQTLDAWAQVLTERKDWPELAELYLANGRPDIAARAFEEAGNFREAYRTYAEAGIADGMERCLAKVIEERVEKHDFLGAAQAYASAGKLDKAAAICADKHPEKAHRWFVEGGYIDRALELARHEARRAEGHDDYDLRATWLGRAGDHIASATLWEAMGKTRKALTHYEQAKAWEGAARCAEFLGKEEEAVEHYYRANLPDQAERVKLHGTCQGPGAPEPPPAPAKPEGTPDEGEPQAKKKRRRSRSRKKRPAGEASATAEERPAREAKPADEGRVTLGDALAGKVAVEPVKADEAPAGESDPSGAAGDSDGNGDGARESEADA